MSRQTDEELTERVDGAARTKLGFPPVGVVIPAFDEAPGLAEILPRIASETHTRKVEVFVASDGSRDETPIVARRLGAIVLHTHDNRGKSAALRDGVAAALDKGCDPLVFIDGDGQHEPEEIARVVAPILSGDADMVLGSRYVDDEHRGSTPRNRYLVRTATCHILARLLGQRLTDPYCGFRALSREAIEAVEFAGSRYQCELEMLFAARAAGLRMAEVPVTRRYGAGMTKMGAKYGRLIGRIIVLSQYGRALRRGARQLRGSSLA